MDLSEFVRAYHEELENPELHHCCEYSWQSRLNWDFDPEADLESLED